MTANAVQRETRQEPRRRLRYRLAVNANRLRLVDYPALLCGNRDEPINGLRYVRERVTSQAKTATCNVRYGRRVGWSLHVGKLRHVPNIVN